MKKKININYYGLTIILIGIASFPIIFCLFYFKYTLPGLLFSIFIFYLINVLLSLWIMNSKKRTNYTKSTWLLAFIMLPIIGITLFLIWGRSPYEFRNKEKYFKYENSFINEYNFSFLEEFIKNEKDDKFKFIVKYNYFQWQETVYIDNNIEIIPDNELFYKEVLSSIKIAKKIILINYYIISDKSVFWNLIKKELIKKAQDNVEIYIVYDRFGTNNKLSKKTIKELYLNKINILAFESNKDYKLSSTTNFRNHKKLLLIDNKLAITGGSNIADEYLNLGVDYPNWTDFNFKLSGSIIQRLAGSFCSDWKNNVIYPKKFYFKDSKNTKSIFLKIMIFFGLLFKSKESKKQLNAINNFRHKQDIWSKYKEFFKNYEKIEFENNITDSKIILSNINPRFYNKSLVEQLTVLFSLAKKTINITSPYFYPDDTIIDALNSIAKFGVKINIFLPNKDDRKWFLLHMNRSNYWKLENHNDNINIYEFDGFIHSKVMTIDDEISILGSFNLDLRSSSSNFENFLAIKSKEINKKCFNYIEYLKNHSTNSKDIKAYTEPSFFSIATSFLIKIIQPLL